MTRFTKFLLPLTVAAGLAFASAAFADNPQFNKAVTYSATTTALTATGKATGLGSSPVAAFLTATSVDVSFQCQNHGQNFAPGHPATSTNVTGPSDNITPHNGQITFSASLPATIPSAKDVCPSKQWKVVVSSVDYNGVVLHIQSSTDPGVDLLRDPSTGSYNCSSTTGTCSLS
jgi:hypothetical protein